MEANVPMSKHVHKYNISINKSFNVWFDYRLCFVMYFRQEPLEGKNPELWVKENMMQTYANKANNLNLT